MRRYATRRLLWAVSACSVCLVVALAAEAPQPKRINRAIELLEQGQPIYYTGSHEGTEGSFAQGVKDAQTWADYISYDMEHAPFDVKGLADYMQGLAKGGPTKSGHRTPAVIVNVPVNGTDEATVRANAWMFQQVLATGVHGVLLCHADTPGAVRAFVEAVRFPEFGGRRGVHGNPTAARVWGISADDYGEKADAWPINPKGELLLGVKLEDKFALENAEANAKVPGVGFAEWGPGDMAFSLGVKQGPGPLPPVLQAARAQRAGRDQSAEDFLPEHGERRQRGRHDQGRRDDRRREPGRRRSRPKFTNRTMPW